MSGGWIIPIWWKVEIRDFWQHEQCFFSALKFKFIALVKWPNRQWKGSSFSKRNSRNQMGLKWKSALGGSGWWRWMQGDTSNQADMLALEVWCFLEDRICDVTDTEKACPAFDLALLISVGTNGTAKEYICQSTRMVHPDTQETEWTYQRTSLAKERTCGSAPRWKGKAKREKENKISMKEMKVRIGYKGRMLPRHAGMVSGKLARARASVTTSMGKE